MFKRCDLECLGPVFLGGIGVVLGGIEVFVCGGLGCFGVVLGVVWGVSTDRRVY